MYCPKNKILKIIDFGSGVKFNSNDIKPRKRVGTVIISFITELLHSTLSSHKKL